MASQEKSWLISVIVPIFQVEKYLKKCISSIIDQSYHNLEIILVDDGSTDNCPAICDQYKEEDSRVKVIHKKNGGLSQARNVGLKFAKGDFIGFVDSDDWIEPNMYEVLLTTMLKVNADIAVCSCQFEPKSSRTIFKDIKSYEIQQYSSEDALRYILSGKNVINFYVWNKLYKRKILTDITFSEGKIYEDSLWTPLVIGNAKIIVCIDYPLYHYLYRSESLSHNVQQIHKRIHDKIEMCEQTLDFIHIKFPYLERIAISYIQLFCCINYVEICIKYSHVDENKEIRQELIQHFRQFGFKSICFFDKMKFFIIKLLFWFNPRLVVKAYKVYKTIC